MHHLFLGLDPVPLGQAPFPLATSEPLDLAAADIGLGGMSPSARVHVLPCIAGHVGADAAAVMLATRPDLAGRADAGRRRRHQRRDRARQPPAPARLLVADRPRLRGGADLLGPARRPRRHRARAHRPRDQGSRASASSARSSGPTSRASPRPEPRHRRHRHLRLGHHRGGGRDARGRPPRRLGAGRRPRAHRLGALRRPRGAPSRTCCTRRRGGASSSRRPTSAPSSSPSPRSTPARGC